MIAHVFNSSVVSGPETLVIPALKNLDEEAQVIFLTETRCKNASLAPLQYARDFGLRVHEVPVHSRWDTEAFDRLGDWIRSERPRVLHAHDVKASVYTLKAAHKARSTAPRISTHHGAAARPGLVLRLYEQYYVRRILPHYDAVLSVCESDVDSLLSRGLKKEQVRLHLNGIDRPEITAEDRATARREIRRRWSQLAPLPQDEDAVFIGVVARLSSEKRHEHMLRSFRRALENWNGPPLKLLCFGQGRRDAELRTLTRSLGLEDAVHWMGYSRSIGSEMAGFDLILSLSSGEGIPITLLEAGWAGTPVLSTAVGGIPGTLEWGISGWLVDVAASEIEVGRVLADVCSNPVERIRIGSRYQSRIKTLYSEKAWLKRLGEIYRDVMARPLLK